MLTSNSGIIQTKQSVARHKTERLMVHRVCSFLVTQSFQKPCRPFSPWNKLSKVKQATLKQKAKDLIKC